MLRILILVGVLTLACKMILGCWPWDYLQTSSTRGRAAARARKLLGVPPSASYSEIIAAHKRLVALVHPDRGGTNEQVHEANAARDLLLDDLPDKAKEN
ncbi:MAG: J domain-containing protein [Sphingomonadaceae bacterium]